MENVFGPFAGLYIAISIRDLGGLGTSFLAQYKICREKPVEFAAAEFLRSKCVEGICGSLEEAQEIALQLARLQIASFPRRPVAASEDSKPPLLPDREINTRAYDPTLPAPL